MPVFTVGCELGYRVAVPTPFVFNVEAAQAASQRVLTEQLTLTPETPIERWQMPESSNRYLRFLANEGDLRVRYDAKVELAQAVFDPLTVGEIVAAELPLEVLTHLYPSRYCQSDRLTQVARRTFGDLAPGYQRINAICNWICDNVEYESGSSDVLTSACDTLIERAGVCRDFAHLGIALSRALGVPARYVSAYAYRLDPPDFHAVFEAYLSGPSGFAWYLFDPTRKSDPTGLVRIGIGRDAAEVAFCTPFGDVEFDKPEVWITSDGDATVPITTEAVVAESR
ncbi:MAG: transglutaminase family protein [Defluviicoccus sp.]|nr:MAG: transglutaminase family protein [Defluviicoccus sp.]